MRAAKRFLGLTSCIYSESRSARSLKAASVGMNGPRLA